MASLVSNQNQPWLVIATEFDKDFNRIAVDVAGRLVDGRFDGCQRDTPLGEALE